MVSQNHSSLSEADGVDCSTDATGDMQVIKSIITDTQGHITEITLKDSFTGVWAEDDHDHDDEYSLYLHDHYDQFSRLIHLHNHAPIPPTGSDIVRDASNAGYSIFVGGYPSLGYFTPISTINCDAHGHTTSGTTYGNVYFTLVSHIRSYLGI